MKISLHYTVLAIVLTACANEKQPPINAETDKAQTTDKNIKSQGLKAKPEPL